VAKWRIVEWVFIAICAGALAWAIITFGGCSIVTVQVGDGQIEQDKAGVVVKPRPREK
jgi:hypothetical protein